MGYRSSPAAEHVYYGVQKLGWFPSLSIPDHLKNVQFLDLSLGQLGMTQDIRRMLMLNHAATYRTVALTAVEIAAVILIVLAMSTATPSTASANAAIAKSTGQPCTKCHTAPPALNNYGKKYKESQKK
jgi:hypothetical protein